MPLDELGIPERELRQPPPRPVRLTATGRRQLLFPALAIPALFLVCAWAYSSRPAPGGLLPVFVGFSGLGIYLMFRTLETWHDRTMLVREGRPIDAVIIDAVPAGAGRSRFVAWYSVDARQWAVEWIAAPSSAEVGDVVTVLYLASDPGRSLVYRAAGCEAVLLEDEQSVAADHSPLTPRI